MFMKAAKSKRVLGTLQTSPPIISSLLRDTQQKKVHLRESMLGSVHRSFKFEVTSFNCYGT